MLIGSFARADEPKCDDECSAETADWCHTKCFYRPDTDFIGVCSQEADITICDDGIKDPGTGIATQELCQKVCEGASDPSPCTAYRFFKIEVENVGVTFKCELLKACKSKDDVTEQLAEAQDHTDGGGRKCVDPAKKAMCPKFLPFVVGSNIVRWICTNTESINPIENDPYYYEQPVGTECKPSHECAAPEILGTELAKCIVDPDDSENLVGKWKDGTDLQLDIPALGACNCPTLRIPAAEGTNLACTTEVKVDNGDFTLGGDSNICALYCDNYFIADLSCRFSKSESSKITWVATWGGVDHDVEGCLSCWENGCDQDAK